MTYVYSFLACYIYLLYLKAMTINFIRFAGSVPVINLGKSKSSNEGGCKDPKSLTEKLCRHQCVSLYFFAL